MQEYTLKSKIYHAHYLYIKRAFNKTYITDMRQLAEELSKGNTLELKSKNYIYAGSNQLDEAGWYKGNCESHSHEVGKKMHNELGIYYMSRNVWEWCLNDSHKTDEDFCIHMGESWYLGEQPSQISAHWGNKPFHFSNSVGFRVIFPVLK